MIHELWIRNEVKYDPCVRYLGIKDDRYCLKVKSPNLLSDSIIPITLPQSECELLDDEISIRVSIRRQIACALYMMGGHDKEKEDAQGRA